VLTFMILAFVTSTQDASDRHVRATEPRVLALIDAGVSRSATFRRLVATLNDSDVIVYIERKLKRQAWPTTSWRRANIVISILL